RLFDVLPAEGPDALVSYLRLVPPTSPDPEKTYLRVGHSRVDQTLTHFESYVQGKLVARLVFGGRAPRGEEPGWREVTLKDAAGNLIAQWKLTPGRPGAPEVPPLARGWDGQMVLDLREGEPQTDREFRAALAAIERR